MAKGSGGTRAICPSVSQFIQAVLDDMEKKGFSKLGVKRIGNTEDRLMKYAVKNNIEVSQKGLYITAHSIMHAMRDEKMTKGIAVKKEDLISFPRKLKYMDLYYDDRKQNFVYTDYHAKFIVSPNYRLSISRTKVEVVNFVTASRTNRDEFNQRNFHKI